MSGQQETTLEKKVDQLILLIQGNPFDRSDNGLSGQVAKLTDEIAKMKKRDSVLLGVIIGLSLFAGAGIGEIMDFVSKVLK